MRNLAKSDHSPGERRSTHEQAEVPTGNNARLDRARRRSHEVRNCSQLPGADDLVVSTRKEEQRASQALEFDCFSERLKSTVRQSVVAEYPIDDLSIENARQVPYLMIPLLEPAHQRLIVSARVRLQELSNFARGGLRQRPSGQQQASEQQPFASPQQFIDDRGRRRFRDAGQRARLRGDIDRSADEGESAHLAREARGEGRRKPSPLTQSHHRDGRSVADIVYRDIEFGQMRIDGVELPLRRRRTPVDEKEMRHALAQQNFDDAVAWREVGDAPAVQRIRRNDQGGCIVGILVAHGKIQQGQRREFAKHVVRRRPFQAARGTTRLAARIGVDDRRESVDCASADGQLQVQNLEPGIEGGRALHCLIRSGPNGLTINANPV